MAATNLRGDFVKPTQVPRGSLSAPQGLQAGATPPMAQAPASAAGITPAMGRQMDKAAKVDDTSRKAVEERHQQNGADPEIVKAGQRAKKAAAEKEQSQEQGEEQQQQQQQGQQEQKQQGQQEQKQGEKPELEVIKQKPKEDSEETVSRQKVKIDTTFKQTPVAATQLGIKVERNVRRLQMEQAEPTQGVTVTGTEPRL